MTGNPFFLTSWHKPVGTSEALSRMHVTRTPQVCFVDIPGDCSRVSRVPQTKRPGINDQQPIFYNHSFMETSRISALLGPFLDDASLSPDQLDQISTYI